VPKVHHHFHKHPRLDPNLSKFNSVHILTPFFFRMIYAYKVLVRKFEGKWQLGRPRHGWEDNLWELGRKDVNWMHLA